MGKQVKVQRKATEVTELVSRQRNAGREAGGGRGGQSVVAEDIRTQA